MAPSRSSIRALEAMEHLYEVTILGKNILTNLTKHPDAVTEWINRVNSGINNTLKRRVGFEAELYTVDNVTIRIGTVQFCVGTRCLVFQVLNLSLCPVSLYQFLTDKNNCFVGIDIHFKMGLLEHQFGFRAPVKCLDLGATAAEQFEQPELQYDVQRELASTVLGVDVEMPRVDPTQWGRTSKLSDEQVHRACIEAFLNLEIGRLLHSHSD